MYRYASIASIASTAHDLPLHGCKCSITARRRADLLQLRLRSSSSSTAHGLCTAAAVTELDGTATELAARRAHSRQLTPSSSRARPHARRRPRAHWHAAAAGRRQHHGLHLLHDRRGAAGARRRSRVGADRDGDGRERVRRGAGAASLGRTRAPWAPTRGVPPRRARQRDRDANCGFHDGARHDGGGVFDPFPLPPILAHSAHSRTTYRTAASSPSEAPPVRTPCSPLCGACK